MTAKLNVNIDHVATVRQARRAPEPNLIAAAFACEQAGAHGITVHLRGDRRHIQDEDVYLLRKCVSTYLNVELAATEEMVRIALETQPDAVTLVPESPQEITTEGGLNVSANISPVRGAIKRLREGGILTSIFVDPDMRQIEAAQSVGAQQVELCTAEYAELTQKSGAESGENLLRLAHELKRLREAAIHAGQLGLRVAAGHGLTYRNIGAVAAIPEITEFNIGHNIVSRAIFVGLERAVGEMLSAIKNHF
jgi:pyridoxine 5-phosphate synthase